jgi:hypothetical protein
MKYTDSIHRKFRDEVCAKLRKTTHFDTQRKAFFRYLPGSRKQYLKGVHRVTARAFGSLHKLIKETRDSGEANETKSKKPTARGSRIGTELCRWAAAGPKKRKLPKSAHPWTVFVAAALQKWDIHLLDGEVPVSRGKVATGVDLLGVKYHPKDLTWHLVCIELKSGYRGTAWRQDRGLTKTQHGTRVTRSIRNYALTQLQLTQRCAAASLKNAYEFDAPLLLQVNDDGVTKSTPNAEIQELCDKLLRH